MSMPLYAEDCVQFLNIKVVHWVRICVKVEHMNQYSQLAAEAEWSVDSMTCQVIHDTGLIIRFETAPDGLIDGFPLNRDAWMGLFDDTEQDFAQRVFCALINEGTQIYCRSLARRN